jgi:hypothetical protein
MGLGFIDEVNGIIERASIYAGGETLNRGSGVVLVLRSRPFCFAGVSGAPLFDRLILLHVPLKVIA